MPHLKKGQIPGFNGSEVFHPVDHTNEIKKKKKILSLTTLPFYECEQEYFKQMTELHKKNP